MTEGVRGGAGSGFTFQVSGFRFQVSGVWFHVLGVRLLSPPETGGEEGL